MDLDDDGYHDVLSGSWPGEIYLFKGGPDHTFAAGEMLKDKDGQLINIGGGIREEENIFASLTGRQEGATMILITGTAEWENTDEGTFVTYRGQRLQSTREKPIATTGTASTVHPADWDGDGDYDLIVGDIKGNVYLIPNEGTSKDYAFGKEMQLQAGGKPLSVGSRAGPCAADWDNDGDLDLLVGDEDGIVWLFPNTGSPKAPKLTAAIQLVEAGRPLSEPAQSDGQVLRGCRAKVCVADWNGDGKPDLLVGDVASVKPNLPEPTSEEKAEFDRMRSELETISRRYGVLGEELRGPSSVRDEAERRKLERERETISQRMSELRSKLPPERENHGWVWLFLRR